LYVFIKGIASAMPFLFIGINELNFFFPAELGKER